MSRTADSTIKGFLYQFNKTIIAISEAAGGEEITVEGLIEDIDIETASGDVVAVQCKYHESATAFTDSLIFKPLLQMAEAYSKSPGKNIEYKIYIHVPGHANCIAPISMLLLDSALATVDVKLCKIVARITAPLNKALFLTKVEIEFGPSIDDLEIKVKASLADLKINGADIDCILYPNSINHIAKLSSLKDENRRKITRASLMTYLANMNSTAISKWVLASKNKRQILEAVRKQLAEGLGQNSRERFFYFAPDALENFESEFVLFTSNYVNKYAVKITHTNVPLFAIDCEESYIPGLQYRLYKKQIRTTTGIVGNVFEIVELFREPLQRASRGRQVEREFDLRLSCTRQDKKILNHRKSQDLFCICDTIPDQIDLTDVNLHHLGMKNFKELEYVLNLRSAYE